MALWFSLSVIPRSWLAFPMVKVCKPLQMSAHCWTNFLQLSPTRGGNPVRVAHKSVDRVATRLLPKFEIFLGQVKDGFKII